MFGTNEVEEPKIQGKTLNCLFCGSKRFKVYEVRLFVTHRSVLHVPLGGLTGRAYVCRSCGYAHDFYQPD